MSIFLSAIAMASLGCAEQGLDAASFERLLDAASSGYRDFSCEYEGSVYMPRAEARSALKLPDNGLFNAYSGRFAFRRDGAMLQDVFQRAAPRNEIHRKTVAVIDGKGTIYERSDDTRGGGGEVRAEHPIHLVFEGSFGRLFCLNVLKWNLRYPRTKFIDQGTEVFAGHRCQIVAFPFGADLNDEDHRSIERFWIDLDRGGNILQREDWTGRRLVTRTTDIELRSFSGRDGNPIWLPYHGVYRVHQMTDNRGKNPYYVEEPWQVEDIWMVPSSLKIDSGLADSDFSVKFRAGTPISDKLRRVQYEFGRDQRPPSSSVVESEGRLKQYLDDAKKQGDELKASSAARAGRGWLAWFPWVLAGLAVAALGAILIRKQRFGGN